MQHHQQKKRCEGDNADGGRTHATPSMRNLGARPAQVSDKTWSCTSAANANMPETANQNGAFGRFISQVTSPAWPVFCANRKNCQAMAATTTRTSRSATTLIRRTRNCEGSLLRARNVMLLR